MIESNSCEPATEAARTRNACIRLCSDGAKRGNGDSAAGMAVVAYFRDGSSKVLRRSGKLLGNLSSAFVAEAVSLEWCLDVFLDWACNFSWDKYGNFRQP